MQGQELHSICSLLLELLNSRFREIERCSGFYSPRTRHRRKQRVLAGEKDGGGG